MEQMKRNSNEWALSILCLGKPEMTRRVMVITLMGRINPLLSMIGETIVSRRTQWYTELKGLALAQCVLCESCRLARCHRQPDTTKAKEV